MIMVRPILQSTMISVDFLGPKFNWICLERGEISLHYVCPFKICWLHVHYVIMTDKLIYGCKLQIKYILN